MEWPLRETMKSFDEGLFDGARVGRHENNVGGGRFRMSNRRERSFHGLGFRPGDERLGGLRNPIDVLALAGGCVRVFCGLQLRGKRSRQFWWRFRGQASVSRSDPTTPFILERANPSKDGDAKPWAFGMIAGGCQAAEGMGR